MDNQHSFDHVFEEELKYVGNRRKGFESREVNFCSDSETSEKDPLLNSDEADERTVHDLQEDVLNLDLCGLAISGGGIRSATFGLGVLQGLAKATLLSRFDYLSTVSGGGYIGSFLSKWIYETCFEECESGLAGKNAALEHDTEDEFLRLQSRSAPAKEICHLRQYSNYLAPTAGMFSMDSWLLIAIYIRNLFLNQAVLFLGAIGAVQMIRALSEVFCLAQNDRLGLSFPLFSVLLLIFMLGQVTLMWLFRESTDIPERVVVSSKKSNPDLWWTLSRFSAVGLALFVSIFSEFGSQQAFRDPTLYLLVAVQTLAFALLAGYSHRQNGILKSTGNVLAGAVGGMLGGLLAALILKYTTCAVQTNVVFSVPTVILTFVVSEMVYVGLAGLLIDELDREWWSSVNSRLLLFCLGWVTVTFIVIYSPWLLGLIAFDTNWPAFWAIVVGSAGTIFTALAGLLAAGAENTNGGKNKVSELLASIAPAIFLALLFSLVSIAVCWLSYEVFALQGYDGFLKSLHAKCYFPHLGHPTPPWFYTPAVLAIPLSALIAFGVSYLLSQRVGVNTFSLHNMYSNRLVRCYLGATTKNRTPNRLTNFDPKDDIELSRLDKSSTSSEQNRCKLAPFHLINGALNRSSQSSNLDLEPDELARLLLNRDRLSESFVFTPIHCGSESTGYRPTREFGGQVKLGHALSVSGAAVSPNMGYHSSAAIRALLTVFNLRLGAWFGNPRSESQWKNANPTGWRLLLNELKGNTNAKDKHVYVSDGGHFENMGVYELLRRRCRFIVAVDADSARDLHENIGRLVRMARIDFGVRIELDSTSITPDANGGCKSHVVVGRIHYGDVHKPGEEQPPHDPSFLYENNQGIIVWIALAVTGDEPADLSNYRAMNPDFPYRTTGDQFFDENEFESYRELGEHSIESTLSQCTLPIAPEKVSDPSAKDLNTFAFVLENKRRGGIYRQKKVEVLNFINKASTKDIFNSIYDKWLVQPKSTKEFVALNKDYVSILEKLRTDSSLDRLGAHICGTNLQLEDDESVGHQTRDQSERLMIGEMLKLLENAWAAFDFQNNFLHPMYRGWLSIFRLWTGNEIFEKHWFDKSVNEKTGIQNEFNPDFQRFIEAVRRIENSSYADTYDVPREVESPFLKESKEENGDQP